MSSNDMAVYIADKLRSLSRPKATVTAEKILAKVSSADELSWWYEMLTRIKKSCPERQRKKIIITHQKYTTKGGICQDV